jgi:hypothetical protein
MARALDSAIPHCPRPRPRCPSLPRTGRLRTYADFARILHNLTYALDETLRVDVYPHYNQPCFCPERDDAHPKSSPLTFRSMDPTAAVSPTTRKRARTGESMPPVDSGFVQDPEAGDSGGDEDEDEDGKPKDKKAGRRKIKIEFIQDKSRRHITFSKRKAGECSTRVVVP